jgi:hypothetical protein
MSRTPGSKNKPKDPTAAKKPRKAKAPKAAAQPSSQSSGAAEFKRPEPSDIVALVTELDALDVDKKDLADSGKEWIDAMAETKGLDKKAFAMVRALWKLGQKDASKLAITLPHLLSYIDDLNLASMADNHRGFEINGEETTGAEDSVRLGLSVVPKPMFEGDAA